MSTPRLVVTEVADRVFHARTGDLVSWSLVLDGDAVLLVDAGYPADALQQVTLATAVRNAWRPGVLPGFFHHDRAGALASPAVLGSVEADVLLPGHGEPHRGGAAGAARAAVEPRRP